MTATIFRPEIKVIRDASPWLTKHADEVRNFRLILFGDAIKVALHAFGPGEGTLLLSTIYESKAPALKLLARPRLANKPVSVLFRRLDHGGGIDSHVGSGNAWETGHLISLLATARTQQTFDFEVAVSQAADEAFRCLCSPETTGAVGLYYARYRLLAAPVENEAALVASGFKLAGVLPGDRTRDQLRIRIHDAAQSLPLY